MINDEPFIMPWPPSANRYWRHVGNRVLISEEARAYKKDIKTWALFWKRKTLTGRLSVAIYAHPPDKRARDLDNILKISIDSLQDAGLFYNDSQIDRIMIQRMPVKADGELVVYIGEL